MKPTFTSIKGSLRESDAINKTNHVLLHIIEPFTLGGYEGSPEESECID